MGIIRKLPDTVANKIAAGEVIERPASVVKELVENAVDAESSRIGIEIEDGGKRLIRVSDNGTGIGLDDLAMAVESHATSKLKDSNDLFFITTLGFRGEAVPSIGAVSEMCISSRARGSDAGGRIEMTGGRKGPVKAAGVPEGTIVEVRNLFFNIPARRKFLKTTSTELSHIVDIVTKMSLAYPDAGFRLMHNGREVFNCLENEDRLRRIAHFFGKELQTELLSVRSGEGPLTIDGYIGPPSHTRSNTKLQYVFLNGRFIRDKTIASAIRGAYAGTIPAGRQPIVVLFLQIDPREVDVNVHPTKHEVRFRNSQLVYLSVRRIIEDKLSSAGPPAIQVRRELSEELDRALDKDRPPAETRPRPSAPPGWDRKIRRDAELFEPRVMPPRPAGTAAAPPWSEPKDRAKPADSAPEAPLPTAAQIHNSYLIEETADGLRIIDQHALHERVLYEQIRQRLAGSGLESQRLLIPVTVELTSDEVILLSGAGEEAKALGFEIEEFGRNTIALRTIPVMLQDCNTQEVLHDLIDSLQEDRQGEKAPQLRESLMRMIACKAAVKANQRLTPSEIASLLQKSRALGPGATCPHGRPTTLTLSLEELAKHFLRK